MKKYDAVVVGSGPNGLAAAVTIAQQGFSVLVIEGHDAVGGGTRSAQLTLDGFTHDICSAFHPLGISSPFFDQVPLQQYGLKWVHPQVPMAHPLDDGTAMALHRSISETAETLDAKDRKAYRRVFQELVEHWHDISPQVLGPPRLPNKPLLMVRFGMKAIRSARGLAYSRFRGTRARALFGGLAGHAFLPLDSSPTAAFGLMLGASGHALGWPMPEGGSQAIADSLAGLLRHLGGEVQTGHWIKGWREIPEAEVVLFDTTPRQLIEIASEHLAGGYLRRLERYRHGPGVFKADYALDGPIPWRAEAVKGAGTVHIGGTFEEIAHAEDLVAKDRVPEKPFMLVGQQSVADRTRAPEGKHTAWAYCHVPHGCEVDMTEAMEDQIERFAPGFRDLVLARHTMSPKEMHDYNPNYIGGDIGGGSHGGLQLFARPVLKWDPYSTSDPAIFICSSSTPPGGGVHGMCGYHAAQSALKRLRTSA